MQKRKSNVLKIKIDLKTMFNEIIYKIYNSNIKMERLQNLTALSARRLLGVASRFERRVIQSFPSIFGAGNVQIGYQYQITYKKTNKQGDIIRMLGQEIHYDFITLQKGTDYLEQIYKLLYREIYSDSQEVEIKNIQVMSTLEDRNRGFLSQYTRMQNFQLKLDGEPEHNFDTGKKNCVVDFLNFYYKDAIKNRKLPKECLSFEWLNFCFEAGWQDEGVCAIELKNWCISTNTKMIAVNKQDELISIYNPEKRTGVNPLIYRIHNNHIYPHPCPRSISQKQSSNNPNIKGKKPKEDTTPIEIVEAEDSYEFLFQKMIEEKTEVLDKNIEFGKRKVCSFKLGGNKYIIKNNDTNLIIQHCINHEMNFTGQKISDIVKDGMKSMEIEKSRPNSKVADLLNQKQIKNRIHLTSTIDEVNESNIDELSIYDIKACHYNILNDPIEPWIFIQFKDNFEPYKKSVNIKTGLYYVETSDNTLLFGSNIYSSGIIRKALHEQIIIHDQIKAVLIPSKVRNINYFQDLLNSYGQITEGQLLKNLYCTTSGLLGKNFYKIKHSRLTTNLDTAFEYTITNTDKDCFVHQHNYKNHKFYFYGHRNKKFINEKIGRASCRERV